MTYIPDCLRRFLLVLLLLMGSSCSSLLNTTPVKAPTTSRSPKQKTVAQPNQVAAKKVAGQPAHKVSAVKPPVVHAKSSTKQQPLANRTEVPLKGTVKRTKKPD